MPFCHIAEKKTCQYGTSPCHALRCGINIITHPNVTHEVENYYNYVGGNSSAEVAIHDPLLSIQMRQEMENAFPPVSAIFKIYDVASSASDVIKGMQIVELDGISMGLLARADVNKTNSNKQMLIKIMDATYAYIKNTSYFADGYQGYVFRGQSLHKIDYELSQSDNPQNIIDKYYEKAKSYYISCGYDHIRAVGAANEVVGYLEKYNERREEEFAKFTDYIWGVINEGK